MKRYCSRCGVLISDEYMITPDTNGGLRYICRICAPKIDSKPMLDTPRYGMLPIIEVYPYEDRFMARCGLPYKSKTFFISEDEFNLFSDQLEKWKNGE